MAISSFQYSQLYPIVPYCTRCTLHPWTHMLYALNHAIDASRRTRGRRLHIGHVAHSTLRYACAC
eukprot:scaffold6949_cov94-Isochrysis_galbana.AAC.1